MKLIFSIPFTGKTPTSDNQSQEWYKFRAGIFEEYTLESLKNQTDKDFLIWLQFRPEDEDSLITAKIKKALKESGLEYLMTFNGAIMKEDRATWHNKDLIERAEKSLKEMARFCGGGSSSIVSDEKYEDVKYIYETNLDSDDMLHKDFVKTVKSKPFREHGALYCRDGYVYEISERLAKWYNPTANQNYTIMYPIEIYFDAKKHFKYQNGLSSHEQVPELFEAEELPKGMYCSIISGTNISTVWSHPFQKDEIYYEDEKSEILKDFFDYAKRSL